MGQALSSSRALSTQAEKQTAAHLHPDCCSPRAVPTETSRGAHISGLSTERVPGQQDQASASRQATQQKSVIQGMGTGLFPWPVTVSGVERKTLNTVTPERSPPCQWLLEPAGSS